MERYLIDNYGNCHKMVEYGFSWLKDQMSIRVDAERSKCLSVKLFTEKEGN